MIYTLAKLCLSRIMRFTCSARSGALQWETMRVRFPCPDSSRTAISAILASAFLIPMPCPLWTMIPLSPAITGLMFSVEATSAFTLDNLPFFLRVSRLSRTK